MNRTKDRIPAQYASLQFFYWMTNLSIYSFSSAFLLPKGFSSSQVGIVMTLGSIGSLILEPVLADIADRSRRLTPAGITSLLAGLLILCLGGLLAVQGNGTALFVFYVLCYILQTIMQPLINEMNFVLERAGHTMNYGVARAMGSLGYSLFSAILGVLTERYGISMIPLMTIVVLAVMLFLLAMLNRSSAAPSDNTQEAFAEEVQKPGSLAQFARSHGRLLLLTAGGTCLLFCSNACGSYLLQIVNHVGGTTENMGFALSVAAASEIPAMVLFERVRKRVSTGTLLKIAGIGYIVKHVILLMAKSYAAVLFAMVFQLVSFAVYIPAIVAYMHEHTSAEDAVKGQSLMPLASSAAGLLSSFSGGFMIDRLGVSAFLTVCVVMAVLGTLIVFAAVGKEQNA